VARLIRVRVSTPYSFSAELAVSQSDNQSVPDEYSHISCLAIPSFSFRVDVCSPKRSVPGLQVAFLKPPILLTCLLWSLAAWWLQVRRFFVLSNNKPSSHLGSAWDQQAFVIDGTSHFTKNSAIIIKVVPERT